MSHTTTVKTVAIKDIKALKAAVDDLARSGVKCRLVENEKPRMYYEHQPTVCDYVLRLDGHGSDKPMDVGFLKQPDGSYAPVFDEWSNTVRRQIGVPRGKETAGAEFCLSRLTQLYSQHAVMRAASASGYTTSRSEAEDGAIVLVLTGI